MSWQATEKSPFVPRSIVLHICKVYAMMHCLAVGSRSQLTMAFEVVCLSASAVISYIPHLVKLKASETSFCTKIGKVLAD